MGNKMNEKDQRCFVCQKKYASNEGTQIRNIEEKLRQFILKEHPTLKEKDFICYHDLVEYRLSSIEKMIQNDSKEMDLLNAKVVKSIKEGQTVSENINQQLSSKLTLGQKVADSIARFGGSWIFIFSFIGVLVIWIIVNSIALFKPTFDPYPFILLNLVLSCLAAIQAPVIMMSQNRQESRDRAQSNSDYQVNLKSEIEIRLLHEKMDYMLNEQWQHLLEIQTVQVDLLNELHDRIDELEKIKS
ncbi:conserved hypothetical protein [Carnobacterium divergens]|nr:conserved hypothetical protein [Carnobacterium divergens]